MRLTLAVSLLALGSLQLGCAGSGTVPDGYEAAMTRPPADGASPRQGLLKRGHRALVRPSAPPPPGLSGIELGGVGSGDFDVAAGDEETVRRLLAEDDRQQDFLFLIAGGDVGQERFKTVMRAVCDHTELYDRDAGKHPTTVIPVLPIGEPKFDSAGEPLSPFRYHVLRTGTLNAMLERTERFRDRVRGGQSIGFLLVTSRMLHDELARVPPDLAPRQIDGDPQLKALQEALQNDPTAEYFNLYNVPPHVMTQAVPYIAGINSRDTEMIGRIVRSLEDHVARNRLAPGAKVRGDDAPLRDLTQTLEDDGICPRLERSPV